MTIPEFRLECLRIVSYGDSKSAHCLIQEGNALFNWIFRHVPTTESDSKVLSKLNLIINTLNQMADKFDPLAAEVTRTGSVVDSAIALINGIAEQLIDAKDDPEQIQAIADELKAKNDALASAVAANTASEGDGTATPNP